MLTQGHLPMVSIMSQEHCPFKVGQMVFYRPSQREKGLSASDSPTETPKVGEAVRILRIEHGKYVVVDGYNHPGGGLYWTEFSAS